MLVILLFLVRRRLNSIFLFQLFMDSCSVSEHRLGIVSVSFSLRLCFFVSLFLPPFLRPCFPSLLSSILASSSLSPSSASLPSFLPSSPFLSLPFPFPLLPLVSSLPPSLPWSHPFFPPFCSLPFSYFSIPIHLSVRTATSNTCFCCRIHHPINYCMQRKSLCTDSEWKGEKATRSRASTNS